jgi:hypothetical protein
MKMFARYRWGFNTGYACRFCNPLMSVAETAAMLGSSETVEEWEKAYCAQVTGSGLFPGVKGCRILTTDSTEIAATALSA